MTELSESGPDTQAAQPSPGWPQPGETGSTDPLVAHALVRLQALPGIAVADHEAAYNDLHDELLTALNEDPADSGNHADGAA